MLTHFSRRIIESRRTFRMLSWDSPAQSGGRDWSLPKNSGAAPAVAASMLSVPSTGTSSLVSQPWPLPPPAPLTAPPPPSRSKLTFAQITDSSLLYHSLSLSVPSCFADWFGFSDVNFKFEGIGIKVLLFKWNGETPPPTPPGYPDTPQLEQCGFFDTSLFASR